MENRASLLLGEDSLPEWYLSTGGENWVGPLTAADILEKVTAKEIGWAHYVWKPGEPEWVRICDLSAFKGAIAAVPAKAVRISIENAIEAEAVRKAALKEAARKAALKKSKSAPPPPPSSESQESGGSERQWYLHYNQSQFGPFSFDEVCRFLKVGRVSPHAHAWRDGMADWQSLKRLGVFETAIGEVAVSQSQNKQAVRPGTSRIQAERAEMRVTPRRPLVARIFLSHKDNVIVAVCRDISVGGMQVLTDKMPGEAGTRLKMNVSPSGDERGRKIQPFIAEGVIVRLLEDRCGFSFRFEKLPERAKRAIETYITQNG